MLKKSYPYYLANQPQQPNTDLVVLDKYSGKVATRVAVPDARATEQAIAAAVKASGPMRNFKPWARQAVLQHCAQRFTERRDELAEALCIEAGGVHHPVQLSAEPGRAQGRSCDRRRLSFRAEAG